MLTFESAAATHSLSEWTVNPPGSTGVAFLDSTVVHEGRYAARIERVLGSPSEFTAISFPLPADFVGDSLELRGWMKYQNVTGIAGLWLREDGKGGTVAFDNMQDRGLKGTADWTEYRVTLPVHPKATKVFVGAMLVAEGTLWVDDLRLYVNGRPLSEAPVLVRPPTVLDTDHEFDAGSRVATERLTSAQVENLVLLGKVWGFLKYHHPAIVAGKRHWDYDLFRVLPAVLAASDRDAGRKAVASWVETLGDAPPCSACVAPPRGLPLLPRLSWLSDRKLLGADLSRRLRKIYERRPNVDEQFYVGRADEIHNPDFSSESNYAERKEPDAGYRLLSLYRLWNIVEYWAPYRDTIEESWDGVLREFVPKVMGARSRDEYAAAMIAMIVHVHDTHANLWGSLDVLPPRGKAMVPAHVRFVEGQAVVWAFPKSGGAANGLKLGDVIRAIDGIPVETLVKRWRPMYAASNEPTRLRDIGRSLTQGEPGPVRLTVKRGSSTLEVNARRVSRDSLETMSGWTHDLAGPAFRRLSQDVAYLKLSAVKESEVEDYVKGASGARCLVIDDRNYPSEFVVFALGQHLVKDSTNFVIFTACDTRNPGAFHWDQPIWLMPKAPYFEGRVVVLVDEVTQSSAEYHAMAFRSRRGTLIVGSTTAGADGNVSRIPLPGGLRCMISGIGVFYPDHRPTQRVGIVPDVVVRPTVAGIRAGRDEVLEAGIQRALGRPVTEAERAAMGLEAVGSR